MSSVFLYLFVFMVCCMAVSVIVPGHKRKTAVFFGSGNIISDSKKGWVFLALVSCMPVIFLYGLRTGIGTDYAAYEQIFHTLHHAPFAEYMLQHREGNGVYYVEAGYYLLNRLLPSYRLLLFGDIILILIPMWAAVWELRQNSIPQLSLFIYLCTQFVFAMNGVRYVIALSFILLGLAYIMNGKYKKCILSIVIAAMFHTSAAVCILFVFLGHLKQNKINIFRDALFYFLIITFVYSNKSIILLVSNIPFFHRYFTEDAYSFSDSMEGSILWMLHIVPVIMPVLIIFRNKIFRDSKSGLMFKICMMQIPFRMMGLYNTWFTRLARISQVIEVLFIPYMLHAAENKNTRRILILYYVIWYIFYFCYYILVNDQGDSIPYQWIFSRH